jgi:hypothetical protein
MLLTRKIMRRMHLSNQNRPGIPIYADLLPFTFSQIIRTDFVLKHQF